MAETPDQPDAPAKKKPPIKMLAILGIVMVVEAGAIGAAFLLAGGPSEVQATEGLEEAAAQANRPVPVLLLSSKFQNNRSGKSYLFTTDIYVTVKSKHQAVVEGKIEDLGPKITDAVASIFRRAEPAHLSEPERQTLKRQVTAVVEQEFGRDADGEPYVLEVLIPMMHRYNADL